MGVRNWRGQGKPASIAARRLVQAAGEADRTLMDAWNELASNARRGAYDPHYQTIQARKAAQKRTRKSNE